MAYFNWIAFWLILQLGWGIFLLVLHKTRRETPLKTLRFEKKTPAFEKTTPSVTILLVHGFADTPEAWRREGEALAARGYRVICPLLRMDGDTAQWTAALQAAFAEARQTSDKVWVWGHSMGCAAILAAKLNVDGAVFWAPFCEPWLGYRLATLCCVLYRLFFPWGYTLTWFPAVRQPHGDNAAAYTVRRVIPMRTFTHMLRLPRLTQAEPSYPLAIILSQHDTVVRNEATLRRFPDATILYAHNPTSSHALTNAADWRENLRQSLTFMSTHIR